MASRAHTTRPLLALAALVVLGLAAPAVASAVTVSGTAMKDELGHTLQACDGTTQNLAIAVDGAQVGTTSCNATTGAFSFTGITIPAVGAKVTVWFEATSAKGVLYTTAASTVTDITGLTPTQDRAWIRSEQGAVTLDQTLVDQWEYADDTDIPIEVVGNGLDVKAGTELHVDSPVTLALGGGWSIWSPSIHVENGATLTGGNWGDISVSANGTLDCTNGPGLARPICVEPGGTITPFNDGTGPYTRVYYWGQTGTYTVEPGDFFELTLRGEAESRAVIGWATGQTLTVGNNLTIVNKVSSDPYATTVNASYIYLDGYVQDTSGDYTFPTWTGTSTFTVTVDWGFTGGGTVYLPNAALRIETTGPRSDFGPEAGQDTRPDWEFRTIDVHNVGYDRHQFGSGGAGMTAPVNSPVGTPLDTPVKVVGGWNDITFAVYQLGQNSGDWGIVQYDRFGQPDFDWDDGDAWPNTADDDGDALLVFNSGGADIAVTALGTGPGVIVGGSSGGNWMLRAYDGDGALDTGVAGTGILTWDPGGADEIRAIFQSSDTIAAIGTGGATPSWRARTWMASTGTIQTTLQWTNGGVAAEVRDACMMEDYGSDIIVVGRAGAAGSRDWAVKRLSWDWMTGDWNAWDTFNGVGAANAWTWDPGGTEDEATACDAEDDRVYVGGTTGTGASDDGRVRSFWSDGTVEPSWGSAGIVSFGGAGDDNVYDLVTDPWLTNIVVATGDPGNGGQARLRRYDADGEVDTSWGTSGTIDWDQGAGTSESARALHFDANSSLYVGVQASTSGGDGAMRKYDFHGELLDDTLAGTTRVVWSNAWDGRARVFANHAINVGAGADNGPVLVDLESFDARVESRNTFLLNGTNGRLRSSSEQPLVSHNDIVLNGTFWANQGEVRVIQQDYRPTIGVSATTQFHDLSVIGGDKIVAFDDTDPIRVNGVFYARGSSCASPIVLTSATGGDPWELDLTGGGTVDVRYADISWSNALTPVANTDGRDLGGNANWTFNTPCGGSSNLAPNGLNVDGQYRAASSAAQPLLSWFVRNGAIDRLDTEVYSSPRSNQVALWRFDGDGSDSVGAWNLTPGGAASYVAGRFGQGVDLGTSGMDGGDLDLTSEFTIDGWVNTTLSTGDPWPDLVYKGNAFGTIVNYRLAFNAGAGLLEAQVTGNGGSENAIAATDMSIVTDGQWHHVAMTQHDGRVHLYVDGVLRASNQLPVGVTIDTVADGITLGYELGGTLDDWRISSVAYSTSDINGFYKTGRRHQDLVWDADPADLNGVVPTFCGASAPGTAPPCGNGNRMNVQYAGGDDSLRLDGARYWVRARSRNSGSGIWSTWSDYDYWDTVQSTTASVTTGPTVALGGGGAQLPGSDALGTATFEVTTTNVHGFTAYVSGPSDAWGMSDGLSGATHQIAGWGSAAATPSAWPAGSAGFGVSLLSATAGKDTTRWGAGTDTSNLAALKWGWGSATSPLLLHARSTYEPAAQQLGIAIRANAQASIDPGQYTTTLVFTSVPNV